MPLRAGPAGFYEGSAGGKLSPEELEYRASESLRARALAIRAGIQLPDADESDTWLIVPQVDKDTGQLYGLAINPELENWYKRSMSALNDKYTRAKSLEVEAARKRRAKVVKP